MFIECDGKQSDSFVGRSSCSQDNFVYILKWDRKWQKEHFLAFCFRANRKNCKCFFIARARFYDRNVNLKFSFYSALTRKILLLWKLQLCIMIVDCLSTCHSSFRKTVCAHCNSSFTTHLGYIGTHTRIHTCITHFITFQTQIFIFHIKFYFIFI